VRAASSGLVCAGAPGELQGGHDGGDGGSLASVEGARALAAAERELVAIAAAREESHQRRAAAHRAHHGVVVGHALERRPEQLRVDHDTVARGGHIHQDVGAREHLGPERTHAFAVRRDHAHAGVGGAARLGEEDGVGADVRAGELDDGALDLWPARGAAGDLGDEPGRQCLHAASVPRREAAFMAIRAVEFPGERRAG
jgi:hypothetical protein